MEEYHVNLGGDALPNAAQRRRRYQMMLVYFFFCGALLVEGGYRITRGIVDLRRVKRESQAIKAEFRKEYPDQKSISKYAGDLKSKLSSLNKTMEALKKNLPESVPAIQFLSALMDESPPYTDVLTFNMDKGDVVAWKSRVVLVESDEISASELVRKWRTSPVLGQYVKDIMMIDLDESKFVKGVPAIEITCRAAIVSKGK